MSEEKLYAVKNDDGDYIDFTGSENTAKNTVKKHGGNVVTLVEEPEKVVLSKEQAEIVDDAHAAIWPATYISGLEDSSEQRLLIEAYANGYTVEKKYNVQVPKKWSGDDKHYWTKEQDGALTWACLSSKGYMIPAQQFTITEIEQYGLQDCEKVWCDSVD